MAVLLTVAIIIVAAVVGSAAHSTSASGSNDGFVAVLPSPPPPQRNHAFRLAICVRLETMSVASACTVQVYTQAPLDTATTMQKLG